MDAPPTAVPPGTDLWGRAPGCQGAALHVLTPQSQGGPSAVSAQLLPRPQPAMWHCPQLGTSSPCIEPGQPCLGRSRTDRLRREGR